MRSLSAAALVLLMTGAAAAQQPNGASASLTIDGANGPPYPIATDVRTNTIAVLSVSGAANAPYLVARSATGLVHPGSLLTGGGILDLPLDSPPFISIQSSLDATGSSAVGVAVPQTGIPLGHHEALQAVVADPFSPVGWRLTAATQVTVVQGPLTSYVALGQDGTALIDLAPHGFSIPFYGVSYTQLWICANGFITFGNPDSDFTPSAAEFNSGYPRLAPFWTDLEQGSGQIRYTIDANPPFGQAPSLRAEWIGVNAYYLSGFTHTFSAFADANGFCQIHYSTLNSLNVYNVIAGIGPGLGLNPQASKDLSALHFAGYQGAPLESFFELFLGPSVYPGPTGWPNAVDLYGLTLSFQPTGAGSLPGATNRYSFY